MGKRRSQTAISYGSEQDVFFSRGVPKGKKGKYKDGNEAEHRQGDETFNAFDRWNNAPLPKEIIPVESVGASNDAT